MRVTGTFLSAVPLSAHFSRVPKIGTVKGLPLSIGTCMRTPHAGMAALVLTVAHKSGSCPDLSALRRQVKPDHSSQLYVTPRSGLIMQFCYENSMNELS